MINVKQWINAMIMLGLTCPQCYGEVANMTMAKPTIVDVPILLETNTQYQICEPHSNKESFDCLSFNRISFRSKSNGDIIAGITDIVYIISEGNEPKRVEMSSIAHINCTNFSISVQLDPGSKWTHWDYVKKSDLIRSVMDKICELQEEMAGK